MTLSHPRSSDTPCTSFPDRGALLGLDYGTRRLGIAVSNSEQTLAVPVETWNVTSPAQNRKRLKELVEDFRVVGIVIGLPVRLNGMEGDQAAIVRQFGQLVTEWTQRPVAFWDERYSSTEAEVLLWSQGMSPTKNKSRLDRLAAQIILQSYLDAPDRQKPPASLQGNSLPDGE